MLEPRRQIAARVTMVLFAIACGGSTVDPGAGQATSLQITFLGNTVSVGAVQQMDLALLDKGGRVIPGAHSATWTSSNPSVASVDGVGNVRGVTLGGPVTLTASADGITLSKAMSVIPASVVLAPPVATLLVGTSVQLTATAQDAAQLPIAAGRATWSVSPPGVASVDSTGVVTALAPGTITVSATIAGRVGTTQILAGVPSIYDGVWSGPVLTARSTPYGTIQFTVIYGTVTAVALTDMDVGILACPKGTIPIGGSQAISNGQFLLIGQSFRQVTDTSGATLRLNAGATFSGTFTDAATMSGLIAPEGTEDFGLTPPCPEYHLSGGWFVFLSTAYAATKQ